MVTTTGTGTSFGGSSGLALHAGCSWLGSPACNASVTSRMHDHKHTQHAFSVAQSIQLGREGASRSICWNLADVCNMPAFLDQRYHRSAAGRAPRWLRNILQSTMQHVSIIALAAPPMHIPAAPKQAWSNSKHSP